MKTNSIGKSFTIEKILKIDFQDFHISWKASKNTLSGKKVGEKWLNYLQVTKFFPDFLFPRLSFSRPVFFPDFFHLTKNLSRFFLIIVIIIIIIFSYLFLKFIITMFFSCALFIVVEQSSLTKISKCEWK